MSSNPPNPQMKSPTDDSRQGLEAVNEPTERNVTMNSVARIEPIAIEGIAVRTDDQGRYCLNDLHKAAGGESKHRPAYWLENQTTQGLIEEISKAGIPALEQNQPLKTVHGGNKPGTYVCRELVYAYAMWISPSFHLTVIRTFDAVATVQPKPKRKPAANSLGTVTRQCLMMAKAFGLTGNQAILSADRAVQKLTGESPLALMDMTQLHAPVQEQTLTPTEIGRLISPACSAQAVNKLLAERGYQKREGDYWVPTASGASLSEYLDTGKQSSTGTPIKQLKWYRSVVPLLMAVQPALVVEGAA